MWPAETFMKFVFLSLWVKECVCTCICTWTHRISCPGASGRRSDNIEKEILTVINRLSSSMWEQRQTGRPPKMNQHRFLKRVSLFMHVLICRVISSSSCPQVNGISVEEKTHSEVVAAIKAGGNETRMLVVDPETDAFFKRCGVTPTSDHLTGERTHRQGNSTISKTQL